MLNFKIEEYINGWEYYRSFDDFDNALNWFNILKEKFPTRHFRLIQLFEVF